MAKSIFELYEEYKKGMAKFKEEEEEIKSQEMNSRTKKRRLDKLLKKKLKFQTKFAKPFLGGKK